MILVENYSPPSWAFLGMSVTPFYGMSLSPFISQFLFNSWCFSSCSPLERYEALFSIFFFSRECVTLVGRKCQIHDNILSVHSRVLQPQQLTGTQGLYALKVCCFNHFRIWSVVTRRIVLSLLIHPLSLLSDIIPLKVSNFFPKT